MARESVRAEARARDEASGEMARESSRGVIFDMDGVLIDSGAHHREAWRALLEELGAEPPRPDYWRLTIGRPSDEAVTLLLGRDLPWPEARRLADRKRDHYLRLSRQGLPAVRGVAGFIDRLEAADVPRAVATSASRHDVDRLLGRLGLRARFEVVVGAEDVRYGKPDPEAYVRAAAGIAVPPGACLVFEDSVVGIQAARRAGMRVVGVTTAHTDAELRAAGAAAVIDDFEGLAWPL
jgi:beta-phosphoglucomutase